MTKSNEYYTALIKGVKKHSDAWKRQMKSMESNDSLREKVEKAREKRKLVIHRDLSRPKTNIDISWQLWEEGFEKTYQEYLVTMESLMENPASKIHQDILRFGGLDLETEFRAKASKNSNIGLNALFGVPVAVALFFAVTAISDVKLDNPDFVNFEVGGSNLKRSDLKRKELRNAEIKNVELRRTDLSGVDFSGVDLSGIDLSGAKLIHSDLSGAKLIATNLSGVDLRNANLSGVNLSSADLGGAKLSDADLSDAILWSKKLGEAVNLNPEQVKKAKNWKKAIYGPEFRKKLRLPENSSTTNQNL